MMACEFPLGARMHENLKVSLNHVAGEVANR